MILHSAPTNKMMHVDALSRIVAPVDIISLKKELQCHQLADPQIRAISDGLKEIEHDKFMLVEGLIYRKSKDKRFRL